MAFFFLPLFFPASLSSPFKGVHTTSSSFFLVVFLFGVCRCSAMKNNLPNPHFPDVDVDLSKLGAGLAGGRGGRVLRAL